jgi:hypothetical protein
MSFERATPIVSVHDGIHVVRDDLFPGGTKARFLPLLFDDADEVVYASPVQGGAQLALAHVAKALGKKATIFCAKRSRRHPRTEQIIRLGAKVIEIGNGYLNVVQARARTYAETTGARLAPFGVDMPEAIDLIARDAILCGVDPDEVWCAAASGTLARSLARAFPSAKRHVVQVGRHLHPEDTDHGIEHIYPRSYDWTPNAAVAPFPADPHYERKAWQMCHALHGPGKVLFWNVCGPVQFSVD